MADITIVFMGFINQLITGGHHPVLFMDVCGRCIDILTMVINQQNCGGATASMDPW